LEKNLGRLVFFLMKKFFYKLEFFYSIIFFKIQVLRGITISLEKREEVLSLLLKKKSYSQISRSTGVSKTQIGRIRKRTLLGIKTGHQGAPRKLGPRYNAAMKAIIKQNRKIGARKFPELLHVRVSHPTILRKLHELKLKKKRFHRRPILTRTHKEKRMKFVWDNYPTEGTHKKWVFTDEKKFRLDGPDGCNQYWVSDEEKKWKPPLSKDYGRYKGVMVWGAISGKGLLALERTTPKMDGDDYLKMVTGPPLTKIRKSCGRTPTFIQDNASPHKKDTTLDGLKDAGLKVLEWPPLSPDLNPMENVWSLMVQRLYTGEKAFQSEDELWKGIQEVGKGITPEDISPFIDSFPGRLQKVIEKKGEYVLQK
jgi:hypothetical protein